MAEHNTEMIVGNHELMKSLNKKNIFDVIMREGPISRTAISKKVKLALPTVMRVADEFLQEGLILEIGKGDSAGGRKPELLAINPDARFFRRV